MKHFIGEFCEGNTCNMCSEKDRAATHKIGETKTTSRYEYIISDPDPIPGDIYEAINTREKLTAFVCCEHFAVIMGDTAKKWCGV